eukprot:307665_1
MFTFETDIQIKQMIVHKNISYLCYDKCLPEGHIDTIFSGCPNCNVIYWLVSCEINCLNSVVCFIFCIKLVILTFQCGIVRQHDLQILIVGSMKSSCLLKSDGIDFCRFN